MQFMGFLLSVIKEFIISRDFYSYILAKLFNMDTVSGTFRKCHVSIKELIISLINNCLISSGI